MNTPPPSPPVPPAGSGPGPAEFPHGLDPKRLFEAVATPTEGAPGGTARTAPELDEVAAAFPHLEILSLLGAGGMGAVFKARQPALDRFVALKILPAGLLASDPAFAERFAREGRLLARLNHPNIVAVHDFGRAGPFFYLLMEFVDGVNLRQAMRANRFTPDQALALVPRICEALQFAHDEGVLHRDIKPENILLDARGRVKLADFGIAKLAGTAEPAGPSAAWADPALTQAGAALGTPSYMAPEQREHPGAVDHRADIYSLGVVFYELLTGQLPMAAFSPPSATAAVDARIDVIVQRALEKDRALRQQSAHEMKTQVEDVTLGATRASGGVPPPPPAAVPASSVAVATGPGAAAPTARWSGKAIGGAVLTALSFLLAAMVVVAVGYFMAGPVQHGPGGSSGHGGVPVFAKFAVVLAPAFLMALVGTLLGWLGLRDVRASGGARKGRGLGMFAALTWPLVLAAVIEAGVLGRSLVLLVPGKFSILLGLLVWLGAFVGTCLFAIDRTRRWLDRGPTVAAAAAAAGAGSTASGCWIALVVLAVIGICFFGMAGCWLLTYRAVGTHGLAPDEPSPPTQRWDAAPAAPGTPTRPTTPEAPPAPVPPARPTPPTAPR